ncbi:MAG: 3-hydroxyacyl-CoA dehydrogenase NAD-binding domain-containing protein, partial [Chitinophagaceae bacterium]
MNQIAIIGSGTMGNGIAHVFAQNGHPVNLFDIS